MDIRVTVSIMLTAWALLVSIAAAQNACGREWFGSSCQYKCRCKNYNCNQQGDCPAGVACEGGWFGPACQYVDLAYRAASTQPKTTDGNDSSCLTAPGLDYVVIALNDSIHFTWLRVRFSNPDLLYNLTVHFREDASLNCTNTRTALADDTTLDIHCDLSETVGHVILSGVGEQHMCSVYISGGRNVALKQNAAQSSIFRERTIATNCMTRSFGPEKAVDGDRDPNFYVVNTCMHTVPGLPDPNLNVTFSRLQYITRYVLYNRNSNEDRLTHFKLRSFNDEMVKVLDYTDDSTSGQPVYTVTPDSVATPIRLVNIEANHTHNILSLCELEVYGDSACEFGQYGRECEHTCHCAGGQSCFVSTGGCPSGCAAGFMGQDCNARCDPGRYGPGCQLSCSQFCVRDNDTRAHFCANTDGTCLHGCRTGYQGSTCSQGCETGRYGPACQLSCSQFCVRDNDTRAHFCANTDGTCLHGCRSGYQGSTCSQELPLDVVVVAVPMAGGVGVLVLVVVAVVFCRRCKTTKSEIRVNVPRDNMSLSPSDRHETHQTVPDDEYETPVLSTAVSRWATQMGSQGYISSEDIVTANCVGHTRDACVPHKYDSVANTYENVQHTYVVLCDYLASPYEAVVDDSNKDITSTHDDTEYANICQ